MGRFFVDVVIASNRDVLMAKPGDRIPESVKHLQAERARRQWCGSAGPASDTWRRNCSCRTKAKPRFAMPITGGKSALVSNVWLQLLGRHSVFSAVIEPDREDALIGAIVLEELDLLVDCGTQSLYPREPDAILTEIE